MPVAIGTTAVPKIAVGATEIKTISAGTTQVWSGVDRIDEPWDTINQDVWIQASDPSGTGQQLVADGRLNGPAVNTNNRRNYAWVATRKQYLNPYAKWLMLVGDFNNSGLETSMVLSSDDQISEFITLSCTSAKTALAYRTSKNNNATNLASLDYGYSTSQWVIVERTVDQLYRVYLPVLGYWVDLYQDTDGLGMQPHMGRVGCGVCSDRNFFGQQGWANPIDRFRYTTDPAETL